MIKRNLPYIPPEDKATILSKWNDILDSGVLTQGNNLFDFEYEFGFKCRSHFAVATNSGASALEIMLTASGLQGREVIVPTNTFPATVSAIIKSGNIPVITDINTYTLSLGVSQIQNAITKKTGAVILVHMAGLITPEIHDIRELCLEHDIFIFEDASHAFLASHNNEMAGNLGHAAAFSTFATKIITTGEGGVITTSNEAFRDRCVELRNHGGRRLVGEFPGVDYGFQCNVASNNFRMPEMSAALGVVQLKRAEEFVKHRNEMADLYKKLIKQEQLEEFLYLPCEFKDNIQSRWQYIIRLHDRVKESREVICTKLYDRGVETASAYWPACHQQPAFKKYVGTKQYPVAEAVLTRHIALPMHSALKDWEVGTVVETLKRVFGK